MFWALTSETVALFIGHSVLLSVDKNVAVMEHNSPAFLSNYRHTLKYQFLAMLKYAFFCICTSENYSR